MAVFRVVSTHLPVATDHELHFEEVSVEAETRAWWLLCMKPDNLTPQEVSRLGICKVATGWVSANC